MNIMNIEYYEHLCLNKHKIKLLLDHIYNLEVIFGIIHSYFTIDIWATMRIHLV